MLIGQFENQVGAKKRIAVPKKFREELGDSLILTRGFEESLVLVNERAWQDITSDISSASYGLKELRDSTRFLVGGAAEVQLDSQGRFVVPDNLYDYAALSSKVVFVGLMRWVEIWDGDKWEKRDEIIRANGEKTASELSKLITE